MKRDRTFLPACSGPTRRAGFSLIEMAVAVSILSVILALSTTTTISLFRLQRQFATETGLALQTDRLAAQWRLDVHHATSANLTAGCQLQLPDGQSVHYDFQPPVVTRELHQGGERRHRDAFMLGEHAAVSFLASESDRRLLILRISPSENLSLGRVPAVRPLQIEAALNLYDLPPAAEVSP